MALKPESSLTVSLATGALIWGIYGNILPRFADIRVGQQGDQDVESARKAATRTAAGAVAGISLIAKDPTIFIIGGAMVVVADWLTRAANQNNPEVGRLNMSGQGAETALQDFDQEPVSLSGAI